MICHVFIDKVVFFFWLSNIDQVPFLSYVKLESMTLLPHHKKMHGLDFDWLKLQDTVFYKDESCSVRKHTYSTFCTSLDPSWVSKLTSEGQRL